MEKSSEIIGGVGQRSQKKEIPSCCHGNTVQHLDASGFEFHIVYQCLMKCEGDKTYKTRGHCPVCNMHLTLAK